MKTRSSKNNNNNNGGDEQLQELRRSARKRKLNKSANDGKPTGEEEDQQEQEECSSKNSCSGRDGRNDPDLEIVQLPLPQPQVTGENEIADENKVEEEAELLMHKPMKVQLSKEIWFDMLEFVGRRQLGKIVPQVGDRRFAEIVQPFLHNYGRITLASICISGPGNRLIQHAVAIPENIKNFLYICVSYFDTPVINFLQKFQQASLFGNVNLDLRLHMQISPGTCERHTKTLLKRMAHILPSIDNINSIRGANIAHLVALDNANSEMAMAMLKMARVLDIFHDDLNFAPSEIAFLTRWLQTPRDDGKPRVLILPFDYYADRAIDKIAHFIDNTINEEFATAKVPVCFFIRFIVVPNKIDWHDSSMENGETNEKLVIKKMETSGSTTSEPAMALISRYPLGVDKHWIEANEREAINWHFDEQNCRICLSTKFIFW